MFVKSIDNKRTYIDENNEEIKDIGESFLDTTNADANFYSVYKVPADMEMRPDKVSISAYGTDEYTEMVCAYNNIKNPFSIQENDIVYLIALNAIYNDVYEPEYETGEKLSAYSTLKKFIDKTRLPDTVGSQKNNIIIAKNQRFTTTRTEDVLPPNMAKINAPAVEIKNGRIYFGANVDNYGNNAQGNTGTVINGFTNRGSTDNTGNTIQGKNNIPDGTYDESGAGSTTTYGGNVNNGRNINSPNVNNLDDLNSNNLSQGQNDIISKLTGYDSMGMLNPESIGMTDLLAQQQREGGLSDNMGRNVNNINPDNAITDIMNIGNFNTGALNTENLQKIAATLFETPANEGTEETKDNVTVKNGRVFFKDNTDISCAEDGISAGDFVNATIKNSLK